MTVIKRIQEVALLNIIKQTVVQSYESTNHVLPQPFYSLIVYRASCYHTMSLGTTILKHETVVLLKLRVLYYAYTFPNGVILTKLLKLRVLYYAFPLE